VNELHWLIPNFDKKADEAPIEFVKFLKQVRTITFPISSAKFLFFQLQDGATNARSDDVSRIMNVVAVRATAVGRGVERDAERNAVLAGDPKGLVYYVMID